MILNTVFLSFLGGGSVKILAHAKAKVGSFGILKNKIRRNKVENVAAFWRKVSEASCGSIKETSVGAIET